METSAKKAESLKQLPGILPESLVAVPLDVLERVAIIQALRLCKGNRREVAKALNVSIRKVQYRVREYKREGFLGSEE